MEKITLIAGKNMPDGSGLVDGLSFSDRNIVVSGNQHEDSLPVKRLTIAERRANLEAYEEEMSREAQTGVCTVEWNKSSPLSARSLVLQGESIYGKMDEAVLYFDEEWYASKADRMDVEEISQSADEMIVCYQYLALEILSYFKKRDPSLGKGTMVFLLKEGPCPADVLLDPSLKNGLNAISSPLVAAASSAFKCFAENIAALYLDSSFVDIVLIHGDNETEGFRRDDETGRWLGTYLDSEDRTTYSSSRRSVKWIKPGDERRAAAPVITPKPEKPARNWGGFRPFHRG